MTVVYTPKCFFPHVALLHQGFPHCAIFPTAASRRSLGRISVPMWPITLSGRLPIISSQPSMQRATLLDINRALARVFPDMGQIAYALLTRSPLGIAASLDLHV